jgi:hypothetical protein
MEAADARDMLGCFIGGNSCVRDILRCCTRGIREYIRMLHRRRKCLGDKLGCHIGGRRQQLCLRVHPVHIGGSRYIALIYK